MKASDASIALLAILLAVFAGSTAAASANPSIIPRPERLEVGVGRPALIRNGAVIAYVRGDQSGARTARWLARLALESRGLRLSVKPGDRGVVIFRRRAGAAASEAYSLDSADGRVVIEASGDAGLLYGAATLWQLMTADDRQGAVKLAALHIEDRPRFAWRGLLLDSARHMQSAAYIERLIDWMALHKLNVLQWHLTDDQGWRIPINGYPRLTSVGAWRVPASIGPPPRDPRTGRPARYGGYYTRAQIRAIVAHGLARNVTVVPEIEMPSHALSASLAYPELSAGALPPASMQSDWGVIPAAYGLSDHVFAFLDTVLGQVMDLFPSHFIAVGGDEAPLQLWQSMPGVQARMRELGLSDGPGLENYFMRRIAGILARRGRRMVGWDEIQQGGVLPADAVVTSWQGARAIQAAAEAGHDVVIATAPTLYFDNRQSELASEPPGRGFVVSLHDVYALDPAAPPFPARPPGALATAAPPTPELLSDADRAHILGVQGNLWTEHIRTEARLSAMAFPRAAAVAEAGWTPQAERDWADFLARMPAEYARFAHLGLVEDRSSFAVRPASEGIDTRRSQELELCPGTLPLNLEGPRDRAGRSAAFLVQIMKPCWIWRGVKLDGGASIRLAAIAAPNNLQLAAEATKVVRWPAAAPGGAFEVRLGDCDKGPVLAAAPLPVGAARARLSFTIPPQIGTDDLCFVHATAGERDPLWGIDTVEVLPGAPSHG